MQPDPVSRYHEPVIETRHADLTLWDPLGSIFKVECPVPGCNGILCVGRGADFELEELDHCMLCGQHVRYLDIKQLRARDHGLDPDQQEYLDWCLAGMPGLIR